MEKGYGTWWRGKESFAFELIYYKTNDIDKKISFKATVQPHNSEGAEYRIKIIEALKKVNEKYSRAQINPKPKWVSLFPKKKNITSSNLENYSIKTLNPKDTLNHTTDEIIEKISSYLESLELFINEVTKCIIDNMKTDNDNQ